MNTSEIARWALLAALGVVTYLLVLAWQRDQDAIAAAKAAAADSQAEVLATEDVPAAPGAPGSPAATAAAADVPQVPVSATAAAPAAAATPAGARGALNPIIVQTDALRVTIDPVGGDVVRTELLQYPQSKDRLDRPMVLLTQTQGGHVYIAQSGLVGRNGPDASAAGRPTYTSTQARYVLAEGQPHLDVVLTATDAAGVRYEKRYRFARDSYEIDLQLVVHNTTRTAWHGNPYAQLKRDDSEPETSASGFGMQPFVGAAFTRAEEPYAKLGFSDLEDEPLSADERGGWIAMMQHYFIAAWIADPGTTNNYFGRKARDGTYLVGFTGQEMTAQPGKSVAAKATLYVGPKVQSRLEAAAPNLNLTVDYGFLWFLAIMMFQLLEWLYGAVQNWGIAIILLTLIVKLVLYPLSAASYRSMAKMREVAPELRKLQERYSDDRQRLGQEMMALYKKENVNPLGGCLPMLAQMPVFLALYWVLYESVELRLAPFFGWITDLASMDPYFVLPLLMGATMYFQQTLNPPMPDPVQARMMKLMPPIFTVMFAFFPSGLVLYWFVNNLLSIAQQWWVTKQVEAEAKVKA